MIFLESKSPRDEGRISAELAKISTTATVTTYIGIATMVLSAIASMAYGFSIAREAMNPELMLIAIPIGVPSIFLTGRIVKILVGRSTRKAKSLVLEQEEIQKSKALSTAPLTTERTGDDDGE